MKTSFKHVIFSASALLLGFSSCSNEDEIGSKVDHSPKNVTISISAPSTYASEATAVGQLPDVSDAVLFFTGGGVILEVGSMNTSEVASGKTFTDVPGSVTDVIIVANAATVALDAPINSIAKNDPVSKLDDLMFVQANQTNPKTAVNVFGRSAISENNGVYSASVTLTPAISRYEIAKVEAKTGASIKLDNFKLTGIYINNTYKKVGTDYVTKPTPFNMILNYGKNDGIWTGVYPARYSDTWTAASVTEAQSFTPSTAGNVWSYYVLPVKQSAAGTTIDGVAQSAVPHIIIKIEDATASGYSLPNPAYVTIKDLKVGGQSLKELAPGKVYSITSIEIGGENLSSFPETNAIEDISVTATVTAWTNQVVTPEI